VPGLSVVGTGTTATNPPASSVCAPPKVTFEGCITSFTSRSGPSPLPVTVNDWPVESVAESIDSAHGAVGG
jgi:hypothetical protein